MLSSFFFKIFFSHARRDKPPLTKDQITTMAVNAPYSEGRVEERQ